MASRVSRSVMLINILQHKEEPPPPNKEVSIPNVSSNQVEKPCAKGSGSAGDNLAFNRRDRNVGLT